MFRLLLFLALLVSLSCSEGDIYSVQLETLKGEKTNLSEYKGKRMLLYLWTGTCLGHVNDMRDINSFREKLSLPVVSVALMMRPEDIEEVLKKNNLRPYFPIYADPRGSIADLITLEFLPTTVLISEEGKVISMIPGFSLRVLQ